MFIFFIHSALFLLFLYFLILLSIFSLSPSLLIFVFSSFLLIFHFFLVSFFVNFCIFILLLYFLFFFSVLICSCPSLNVGPSYLAFCYKLYYTPSSCYKRNIKINAVIYFLDHDPYNLLAQTY